MKPMKVIFALILTAALFSFQTAEDSYLVNGAASKLHWKARKTTGEHEGNVNVKHGKLKMSGETPLRAEFVIDMTSITVTDIKDAEQNAKLVNHLKSEDFFSTAKHSTAVITVKKFTKNTNGTYTATADLMIKGITNEIAFPVKFVKSATGYTATADITIDRTKWDVKYNSKSILGAAADKFIYDDVNFNVTLVLDKQK